MTLNYSPDSPHAKRFYAFCASLLLVLQLLVQIFIFSGEPFLTHKSISGCTLLSIPFCMYVCSNVSFSFNTHYPRLLAATGQCPCFCIPPAWTVTGKAKPSINNCLRERNERKKAREGEREREVIMLKNKSDVIILY